MTYFGRRAVAGALMAVLAATSTACAPARGGPELLVSAAASLTDAFAEIEQRFEASHPGVDVIVNLGGSSTLREQILEGAPSDVFASADEANMDLLATEGMLSSSPIVFTTNALQIAVPPANPAGVTGLEDFDRPELLLGLCDTGVPCGDLARVALENAGVVPAIDTAEPDVRSLLAKIESGELDAGVVYVTDVLAGRGRVDGIAVPESINVVARYPISSLAGSPEREVADDFVGFVLSDEGQAILLDHGFIAP